MSNSKSMSSFEKFVSILEKICEVICVALVAIIFLVTITQVIARFVFSSPLIWSEELARYCGVWLVMLSTGIAIRQRKHMAIDILVTRFSQHNQLWFILFGDIIVLLVSVFMSYASYTLAVKFAANRSIALKASMGLVYGGTVVGWIASILSGACNVIQTIRNLRGEKAT